MDVRRVNDNEERDEGIERELLQLTTGRLPRYGWLLTGAAAGTNPDTPRGEG